jgi:D-alanyl-D-alanine carboxypeptidase
MSLTQTPPRTTRHAARSTVLTALVLSASVLALPGCRPASAASSAPPPRVSQATAPALHDRTDDGAVPDHVTVFDDRYAAVTRLDPALRAALRDAAEDADDDGVELDVHSGWRSPAYQERLLDEAISRYGSKAEAARWVATPATSPHVSGDAVDIGPARATTWLSRHGARYGLCQIFANEAWHYELRPEAVHRGCPTPYPDPTHDPRMTR